MCPSLFFRLVGSLSLDFPLASVGGMGVFFLSKKVSIIFSNLSKGERFG